MFNDDLSMWGTCDLEDFDQAYNDMLNAQGDEDYVAKVKELQRIASEEVIGIALCWDTAYYPYRTDKYEGWTNFPGWGVINCETWRPASDRLSKGREQGRRRRAPLLCI